MFIEKLNLTDSTFYFWYKSVALKKLKPQNIFQAVLKTKQK